MQILIAPNSFKECAVSVSISNLLVKYLKYYFNIESTAYSISILEMPISDGGDGFISVCKKNFNLEIKSCKITYPFCEDTFDCEYGVSENTVYIESAKVLGLSIIPMGKRHPLFLSSKGLGDILQAITKDNVNKISKVVLGIGGTGTSDFGIGLCSRFGLKLYDENSNELEPLPINFSRVKKLYWQKPKLDFDIDLILDVNTPLLGDNGAAKVFAPQKGAAPEEVELLEAGFFNIINVLQKHDPKLSVENLYGAGGGLGGGLHYFFSARYVLAENFIRNDIGINNKTLKPDIIITGEGSFDIQSLYNKGTMMVINEFADSGKPIFIISGKIDNNILEKRDPNLFFIELSRYFKNKDESIKNIEKGIQFASKEIFEICTSNNFIS